MYYDPSISELEEIENLVRWLLYQRATNSGATAEQFALLVAHRPRMVASTIEAEFSLMLPRLWAKGWLPAEALRQIRRSSSAAHELQLRCAIAAEYQKRNPATVHPLWEAHMANLDLGDLNLEHWLGDLAKGDQATWPELLAISLDTIVSASWLTQLETVIPAPGTKEAKESVIEGRVPTADPMLEKVRNLLAQAESTKFDAEAELFTAKAQELMARHSLDEAIVWSRSENREKPTIIRIAIDEPYLDVKSLLLQIVAEQSRCRAIFFTQLAMSSIVGFEADVHATETLFTSLLLQAQSSMARAALAAPPGARVRSRAFRSSFLLGYANRIDARLSEINDHIRTDVTASAGKDLLPVLAQRDAEVDAAVEEWFAEMIESNVGGSYDHLGHIAGTRAADTAELSKSVNTPSGSA